MASILRVLAALSLLAVPAAPAAAAPARTTIKPHLGTLTVAPGSSEKLTLLWLKVDPAATAEHHITLTLDYQAVASFATIDFALATVSTASMFTAAAGASPATTGPCTASGTVFTCEWDDLIYESDTQLSYAGLMSATPKSSATTGMEGEIQVTAKVDDGTAATGTSIVRVGEGVDLAADGGQEVTAAAGKTTSVTPVVNNGSSTPVNGAVLLFAANPALLGDSNYRNCRYGNGTVACTFDTELAPNASYQLSQPFQLTPPADSMPGSRAQAVAQWTTTTEWADFAEVVEDDYWGESGTGATLELEPVAGSQAAPQSDIDVRNDTGMITLTVSGSGAPDIAAVGAKVTKAASRVTVRVGAANHGSGTLHPDLYGNNQVPAVVRLPGNVSAVRVDDRCDEVASKVYLCNTTTTMKPNEREYFDFVLHVTKSKGKAGRIEVADALPAVTSAGGKQAGVKQAGVKQAGVTQASVANNVAPIVVTGSSGGTGGGLPITGSAAVGIATAGLGLVALGSLLATRRPHRAVYAHAMREPSRGRHRKGPRK